MSELNLKLALNYINMGKKRKEVWQLSGVRTCQTKGDFSVEVII